MVRRRKKQDLPPIPEPPKARRARPIVTPVVVPRPAPMKSARNERTNKPVKRQQDANGKIGGELLVFCVELGYDVADTYGRWSQLALCYEMELGVPQRTAEQAAWRDLKVCLDKRDNELPPS
jgi:hypothetical protein